MKKVMIAAAIVCAAACTQAATASWASDYVFNGAQTESSSGSADYAWAIIETATADLSGISFDKGVLVGATAFDTGVDKTVAFGGGMKDSIDGATAGKYYSLVIWQEEAGYWGISNAVLAETDPTIEGGGTLKGMAFLNGKDPIWGAVDAMTANQPTAVPEPTSGLLLLLGVAGLALRRRRA